MVQKFNTVQQREQKIFVVYGKKSNNEDSQVSPNYESYKFTIDAWTNSYKLADKVERFMNIFNRLLTQYFVDNMQCKPTVDC